MEEADRLRAEIADLSRELARQRLLVEASVSLHSTLDEDELLGRILSTAEQGVEAERGTVYLVSDDGTQIWSRVVAGSERLVIRLPIGRGIAGAVARTAESIRIDDAYADPRFDPSTDRRSGFRTRSILCAPIRSRKGGVVGVFQMLNKRTGAFDDADDLFLADLSVHAALAIENAVLHRTAIEKERQEREIAVAQGIQRGLQPERLALRLGRADVVGVNELCEDASGDYCDAVPLEDGRLALAVGDVSGHGLGAAMVMAEARALFRVLAATREGVERVVGRLNAFLAGDLHGGRFMTFCAVLLDPASGAATWCSAGHNPALVHRACDGSLEMLDATGPVLGVLPAVVYRAGAPLVLAPGDALLLYTDGATEASDPAGDFFEVSRLADAFRAAAGGDAGTIADALRAAVAAWTHGARNRDDLTLLVVKLADRPLDGATP